MVYIKLDPLEKFGTISQFFTKLIDEEANRILKFIKSKMDSDEDLKKLLKDPEYEEILKALEFGST